MCILFGFQMQFVFDNKTGFPLPKQSIKCRSVLYDRSRFLGLVFGRQKPILFQNYSRLTDIFEVMWEG